MIFGFPDLPKCECSAHSAIRSGHLTVIPLYKLSYTEGKWPINDQKWPGKDQTFFIRQGAQRALEDLPVVSGPLPVDTRPFLVVAGSFPVDTEPRLVVARPLPVIAGSFPVDTGSLPVIARPIRVDTGPLPVSPYTPALWQPWLLCNQECPDVTTPLALQGCDLRSGTLGHVSFFTLSEAVYLQDSSHIGSLKLHGPTISKYYLDLVPHIQLRY